MKTNEYPDVPRRLLLGATLTACLAGAPAFASTDPETLARGAYLVEITACADCHTPWKPGPNGPEPDVSRKLSGHPETLALPAPPKLGDGPWLWIGAATNTAFAGPWGVSYAANLTPDAETGLGDWTEEMFIGAIREGKHLGVSRPIMPPMPWPAYRHMSDDDLKAVFAYLKTVPAARNRVPEWVPPAQ